MYKVFFITVGFLCFYSPGFCAEPGNQITVSSMSFEPESEWRCCDVIAGALSIFYRSCLCCSGSCFYKKGEDFFSVLPDEVISKILYQLACFYVSSTPRIDLLDLIRFFIELRLVNKRFKKMDNKK